ncbi:MAG: ABC transporter permease [Acidobacteria bacterium]|nr:ABC transporter permease [Acidobacteriota bacterium]
MKFSKIGLVASSEFQLTVRTKAFVIGLLLMPVLMGGIMFMQRRAMDQVDTETRVFAVVDQSGKLFAALDRAASEYNATAATGRGGPSFVPIKVDAGSRSLDQIRVELSGRVTSRELFAFVEIGESILASDGSADRALGYYSNHPTYTLLPRWIEAAVTRIVQAERFRMAGVDPVVVSKLVRPVKATERGLFVRDATGQLKQADTVDVIRTFGIPAGLMFLMLISVMTATPQLMTTVLEEKMSRISEVMLGSLSPFEFMLGKLVGASGVTLVFAGTYLCGAIAVAVTQGYGDIITARLLIWFVVFLCLAVLLFGSFYGAIGAACSDLKDAQSLMTPVVIIIVIPIATWMTVARAPDSLFAVVISLVPPATPFLMLLRLFLHPAPPAWQVGLSLVLTSATALVFVWAAGKIFRTGLLMQGKSASFRDLAKWISAR